MTWRQVTSKKLPLTEIMMKVRAVLSSPAHLNNLKLLHLMANIRQKSKILECALKMIEANAHHRIPPARS